MVTIAKLILKKLVKKQNHCSFRTSRLQFWTFVEMYSRKIIMTPIESSLKFINNTIQMTKDFSNAIGNEH